MTTIRPKLPPPPPPTPKSTGVSPAQVQAHRPAQELRQPRTQGTFFEGPRRQGPVSLGLDSTLRTVLQLPPGPERNARISQLGLNGAADIRVADPLVTTTGRARVRSGPEVSQAGATDNTLDTFPAGTQLEVKGQQGDFYLVTGTYPHALEGGGTEYVTSTGWVHKSLITPQPTGVPTLEAGAPLPVQPGVTRSNQPPTQAPVAGGSGGGTAPVAGGGGGTAPVAGGSGGGTAPVTGGGGTAPVTGGGNATGTVTGQQVIDAANAFMTSNTSSYMNRCLNFVTTVLAQAGITDPLLAQPSASDALDAVRDAGKLNAWPNPPTNVPVGAVVFWSEPAPDGHAAIYAGPGPDGRPQYMTSPVGSMDMPGQRPITSLLDSGAATPPAGYYLPEGMQQPVTVG